MEQTTGKKLDNHSKYENKITKSKELESRQKMSQSDEISGKAELIKLKIQQHKESQFTLTVTEVINEKH